VDGGLAEEREYFHQRATTFPCGLKIENKIKLNEIKQNKVVMSMSHRI
jgi:hypothetical protein